MKKIFQYILKLLATKILQKYKPRIVSVTGSVGKTSSKEAIACVLKKDFSVRESIKNYNNELGVPLTIIGTRSGGRSFSAWLKVIFQAFDLILSKREYPQVLVLEMGADHPGDIEYLTSFVKSEVGVLTSIGEAHLEYFKTKENILKEKQKIVTTIENGRAILNFDDPLIKTLEERLDINITSYGFENGADIKASDIYCSGCDNIFSDENEREWGTGFKVQYQGSNVPIVLPKSLGRAQVFAALSAIGVGLHFGMNLLEISEALRSYAPAKGRTNVLPGINNSVIIDDTYNASPVAAKVALESMAMMPVQNSGRRVVVFGDMLELGENGAEFHAEIGREVENFGADLFIAVGEYADDYISNIKRLPTKKYKNSEQLAKEIAGIIRTGDVVLVKGSQGARMEKVVKALLRDQSKKDELLVRQGGEWE